MGDMGTAVITETIEGREDSRSGKNWFIRGTAGLMHVLREKWRQEQSTYYVGEWHSHPGNKPAPSKKDIEAMLDIANSPEEQCPEPILLIVGNDLQDFNDANFWVYPKARGGTHLKYEERKVK